jgi:hypothetical protein
MRVRARAERKKKRKRRREGQEECPGEKASYIQNGRDKAELSDLVVAMARGGGEGRCHTNGYESLRQGIGKGRRGSGRWGAGCNMQI